MTVSILPKELATDPLSKVTSPTASWRAIPLVPAGVAGTQYVIQGILANFVNNSDNVENIEGVEPGVVANVVYDEIEDTLTIERGTTSGSVTLEIYEGAVSVAQVDVQIEISATDPDSATWTESFPGIVGGVGNGFTVGRANNYLDLTNVDNTAVISIAPIDPSQTIISNFHHRVGANRVDGEISGTGVVQIGVYVDSVLADQFGWSINSAAPISTSIDGQTLTASDTSLSITDATGVDNTLYRVLIDGSPTADGTGINPTVNIAFPSDGETHTIAVRRYFDGSDEGVGNVFASTGTFTARSSVTGGGIARIDALLASPHRIGYGASATGGAAATQLTTVTTNADSGAGSLREAMLQSGPRWIIFDPSLNGQSINIQTSINSQDPDWTIDGAGVDIKISPANATDEIALMQFRGSNGILHGVEYDGLGGRSQSVLFRNGLYFWIDHVTIHGNEYLNAISAGNSDRAQVSEITISCYHAYNANYGTLLGGVNNLNHLPHRTTIHTSLYETDDRQPLCKNNGEVHIFNCHLRNWIYRALGVGNNSVGISERNVIDAGNANNTNNALQTFADTIGGQAANDGRIYSIDDLMLNGAGTRNSVTTHASVAASGQSIPYSYTTIPNSQVIATVAANAGAGNA